MSCTGGSSCPWHGFGSAITAVGWGNNEWGAVGTGGMIGVPILQSVSSDLSEWKGGVNTALDWGAEVISMSLGFPCDNVFCEIGLDIIDFWGPFERAVGMNVPVIASAGNDVTDVDARQDYPCGIRDVICVGAMEDGTLDRISYSNWGATRVDIWAPTNIPLRQPPTSDPFGAVDDSHGGTSASAPFIAGIVAMMKSVNPSLTVARTLEILQGTARMAALDETTDPLVTYAVNALKAVQLAAAPVTPLADDVYEPNETEAAPARISVPETLTAGIDFNGLLVGGGSNVDIYEFEIDSWSLIAFKFRYARGLTQPTFQFRKMSGGIPPELNWGPAVWDDLTQIVYTNVAPGRYQMRVRNSVTSPDPQMMYDMNIVRQGLPSPIVGDSFEANDWTERARLVERGTFPATIHRVRADIALDTDYYRFIVGAGSPADTFVFMIRSSDGRFRVTLGDDNSGATPPIDTREGAAGVEYRITTPGNYVVGLESLSDTQRYFFTAMGRVRNSRGSPFSPGGAAEFWRVEDEWNFFDSSLIDQAEFFLMPPNPGDIDILGRGAIQLDLFDLDGGHLANGVEELDGQQNPLQRVSVTGTAALGQTVLRVMRPDGIDLEGLAAGEFPIAAFSLQRIPH